MKELKYKDIFDEFEEVTDEDASNKYILPSEYSYDMVESFIKFLKTKKVVLMQNGK